MLVPRRINRNLTKPIVLQICVIASKVPDRGGVTGSRGLGHSLIFLGGKGPGVGGRGELTVQLDRGVDNGCVCILYIYIYTAAVWGL